MSKQIDLFVALVGDVPLADEREAMTAPLVSISKRKRSRIEWTGPSGQQVIVEAPDATGVATIWDYDVILWAVSQINEGINAGLDVSPRIHFQPYSLLKSIGRGTGGSDYDKLKTALRRLVKTTVSYDAPSLKGKRRTTGTFNLLSGFQIEELDGKPSGAVLELPLWLFEAVTKDRDVLAISPAYFDLTSGLDRFLYRLARRHVGRQQGWAFTFADLHKRTGSSQSFGDFSRDLRKAINRNAMPTYSLHETTGTNGPTLSISRDPAKIEYVRDRRFGD